MPLHERAASLSGTTGRRSHVPNGICNRKSFDKDGRCRQCEYRFRIKGKIQRCCNMTMCHDKKSPTMYKDRFCWYHWFLITKGQPQRLSKELVNRYATGQMGDEILREDIFWKGEYDSDDRLTNTHPLPSPVTQNIRRRVAVKSTIRRLPPPLPVRRPKKRKVAIATKQTAVPHTRLSHKSSTDRLFSTSNSHSHSGSSSEHFIFSPLAKTSSIRSKSQMSKKSAEILNSSRKYSSTSRQKTSVRKTKLSKKELDALDGFTTSKDAHPLSSSSLRKQKTLNLEQQKALAEMLFPAETGHETSRKKNSQRNQSLTSTDLAEWMNVLK